MSDKVSSNEWSIQLGPPTPTDEMPEPLVFTVPIVHNHGPGEVCFFCPCQDCCRFYGRGVLDRCVEPMELPQPRYGDMELMNTKRAAAAKREEDRQDKRRAEREGAAGAAEAPKTDESFTDQNTKKTLRTGMKRRRV